MGIYEGVRASFSLLTLSERRRYVVAVSAQAAISVLDLAGVVLIGLVVASAVSGSGDGAPTSASSFKWIASSMQDLSVSQMGLLAAIAAAALLVKSVLSMLLNRHILNVLASSEASVSRRLTRAFMKQGYQDVRGLGSNEVAYALSTGVTYASLIMLSQVAIVVSESFLLVLLVAGLLLMDPFLTFFALLFFAAASAILYRIVMRKAQEIGRRSSNLEIDSRRSVQEVLRVFKEVVVLGRRDFYVDQITELRADAAVTQSRHQFMTLVPKYTLEVAFVLGVATLAAVQWVTASPEAAFATVAVFAVASARIVPSILRLQTALVVARSATGLAEPTFNMMDELIGSSDAYQAASAESGLRMTPVLSDFEPCIDIRDLRVVYADGDSAALEGVSLHVPAGSSVALVGRSGAGKTTLAYAILGLISPTDGDLTVGGLAPEQVLERWPGAMSYVPQDVSVISGSVLGNVALGVPVETVDPDRVWAALDRAHLGEFLRATGRGLDSWVGENGVNFSGGQLQRLGVARALYVEPRLVVLDEATSALDAETENLLSSTVKSLGPDVTVVTIAHRLATVREHDLVVYLEGGRVAAAGTFDEVRERSQDFDRQARLLGL